MNFFRNGSRRTTRGWYPLLPLGLVLILAIALAGCQPTRFKTKAAQVQQLIFTAPSDPATFNYPLNTSFYSVFGYLYTGLLAQNGLTAELEPALAESWAIAPDKRRIIFTLREGLQWSDGRPLTAADVVFTFKDIYLNPQIPTGVRDILRVGTTEAYPQVKQLDDRRVEFTVPEPFAPFLRYSGGLPILPKHVLLEATRTNDSNGNLQFLSTWGTDTNPQAVIGNGLYTMTQYVPSQRVVFQRNPYYWRRDVQGQPQPYIQRVIVQIIESDANQLIRFRSGDLDGLSVKPEQFSLLKKEEGQGHFTIYNGGLDTSTRFVGFNLNQAHNQAGESFVDPIKSRWFNTLAFRQAAAYALDRQRMKDNIYRGLGDLQNSPIHVQSPYYLSPAEGLKTYTYDPEQARQLLLGAGFYYNSAGELFDWDGNRVKFTILVKSEEKSRVDMANQVSQDWAAIGIQAPVQVLSFNTVIQKLQNRNWECYVGGFAGAGLEPHSGFNVWSSQGSLHQFNQGPLPGEPPIQGWVVSPWEQEIDTLFTVGVQELDDTKRKVIYGRFQQIVQEQLPFIYLVNALDLAAVRDRVQNVKFSALGGPFWNLYELQIVD